MSCPVCDGTGWKTVDENGTRRVARCECWKESLAKKLLAAARIPRRYHHCDLDNFTVYNDSLKRGVAQARKTADAFPAVDRGLLLLGPPGVGKTHLAVAVLKQVVRTRGARGMFYDTRDLLRVIRSTYDPIVRTPEMHILQPVMQADLLVLDDLGAEKTSEWVEETLNLIVNTRYNERRTTIFTSNFEDRPDDTDPDSLLFRIGFRMRSRLFEMCQPVEIDGADYRQLPPNGGPDDLLTMWKLRERPARPTAAARAHGGHRHREGRAAEGKADVNWPGGKAGT